MDSPERAAPGLLNNSFYTAGVPLHILFQILEHAGAALLLLRLPADGLPLVPGGSELLLPLLQAHFISAD